MKNARKLLLCSAIAVLLAGCNNGKQSELPSPEPSTPSVADSSGAGVDVVENVSLLDKLVDGGDAIYNVTSNGTTTTIAYKKEADKEWASAKADLSGIDLSKYQSLRFKVTGSSKVLIKLQADTGAGEITLALKSDSGDYEWFFDAETDKFLGSATTLYIFGLPGQADGEDTIVFSELGLRKEAGEDSTYRLLGSGDTNIVLTQNEYDGVSPTFAFNRFWAENDANSYSFTENEDGSLTVNSKTRSWQFAATKIVGTGYEKFHYITFVVNGKVGESVLFKVEGHGVPATEGKVEFTGEDQIVHLDISGYTDEQRAALFQVLMFAAPGQEPEDGSKVAQQFTIKAAYFTTEAEGTSLNKPVEVIEPDPVDAVKYEGYGKVLSLPNNSFKGLDEGVYEYTKDGVYKYNKTADQGWSCAVLDIEGNLGDFTQINYSLTIPEGKQLLLKIEGNGALEHWVTGTGSKQSGVFDLTSKTAEELNGMKKLVIFAEGGVGDVSGQFTVHSLEFARATAMVGSDGTVNLAIANMFDFGDGHKVFDLARTEDGKILLKKAEGQEAKGDWNCVGLEIKAPEGSYSKVVVTVSGAAADKLLVKMENGLGKVKEVALEQLGDHVVATVDISGFMEGNPENLLLVLFANFGTSQYQSEDIVIESVVFAN